MIGLLDSGANRSILGIGAAKVVKACKLQIHKADIDVTTASGQTLDVQGYVNLPITFNGETKIICALIIPSLKRRLLLGTDFWSAFDIVPTVGTSSKVEELDCLPVEPLLTVD